MIDFPAVQDLLGRWSGYLLGFLSVTYIIFTQGSAFAARLIGKSGQIISFWYNCSGDYRDARERLVEYYVISCYNYLARGDYNTE